MLTLNRVIAEDIKSDINMPPFNKAAMDGYACKYGDLEHPLEVVDNIPAGKLPEKVISDKQCAKIMTGAMVPEGADCVIMIEHVEQLSDGRIKFNKEITNKNICYIGEDVKENDIVLFKGTQIQPQHIGILSAIGCTTLKVYKQPKVAIISTGDELVEPNEKPAISQIRNSNGYQMLIQAQKSGAIANYFGIAKDNEEDTVKLISNALEDNDIVLISGGVSMGDYDFVGSALEKIGFRILFDAIAVKPGKPTTFGVKENKICMGMPGNPVSSFIQFEILTKPLIQKMMGLNSVNANLKLPLKKDYKRKKSERLAIIPTNINADGTVEPSEYHGSAHIFALGYSNSFMFVPLGVNEIKAGELVDVRQI